MNQKLRTQVWDEILKLQELTETNASDKKWLKRALVELKKTTFKLAHS